MHDPQLRRTPSPVLIPFIGTTALDVSVSDVLHALRAMRTPGATARVAYLWREEVRADGGKQSPPASENAL